MAGHLDRRPCGRYFQPCLSLFFTDLVALSLLCQDLGLLFSHYSPWAWVKWVLVISLSVDSAEFHKPTHIPFFIIRGYISFLKIYFIWIKKKMFSSDKWTKCGQQTDWGILKCTNPGISIIQIKIMGILRYIFRPVLFTSFT